MIYWVAERVKSAGIANYVVATDSNEIMDICIAHGHNVVMTSQKCATGTDRVAEVAKNYSSQYTYLLNVQGDEPLISVRNIQSMIDNRANHKGAFIQGVAPVQGNENDSSEVKVAIGEDGRIHYFSRSIIPYDRNNTRLIRYKCQGIYLYTSDFLNKFTQLLPGPLEQAEAIEQLRCTEHSLNIVAVKLEDSERSVDTQADLDYMNSLPISRFL